MGEDMNGSPASATKSKISARVQLAANIAIVALCLLVAWLELQRISPTAPTGAAEIYKVGEAIDPVRGVDFAAARITLVMVLREDCHFCQESLPFYRQLSEARSRTPNPDLRVVVASTDSPTALSTYLESKEVRVDQVATVEQGGLKVPGTPSLLLVDRAGKVTRIWRGRLAERQQKEVLQSLGLVPVS